ncbi:coiled-coil domain-containing protein 94, partial [Silurus asotus]
KIPKIKRPKYRQFSSVRLMAPFNMRCKSCGEFFYRGKKFNARKETVQNELYLGLPIFRFLIKCTRCSAKIIKQTDPENTDYLIEHGATRNFQVMCSNSLTVCLIVSSKMLFIPRVLENRKQDSKMEMKLLKNLQEQKKLNQRQARADFESMLQQSRELEKRWKEQEQEEIERE